jgi:small subunit ribosomal protein S17
MSSRFGVVIGTHMQKTIKVRVEKVKMHPVVLKPIRYHVNFIAHDEKETAVVGDVVRIDESPRKISKTKSICD